MQAYGLDDYQLTGLPDWAAREFYTIAASTAEPTPPDQMLRMLRQLLADRFQLQVEESSQQEPVWAIVAAPDGPKLRALKPDQACARGVSADDTKAAGAPGQSMSSFNGCTMEDLVRAFNRAGNRQVLGRPVIDKSGITGRYSMLVWQSYDRREAIEGRRGFRMVDLEPFREAVEKELGLRLVADTATLHFVHVVKVARPTPN